MNWDDWTLPRSIDDTQVTRCEQGQLPESFQVMTSWMLV